MEEYTLIRAAGIYDSVSGTLFRADGMLLCGETIAEIAPFETLVSKAPDAVILDWRDRYIYPALVNTHVHLEFDQTPEARSHFLDQTPGERLLLAAENAKALLYSGVTSVRDAGSTWGLMDLVGPHIRKRIHLPTLQLAGPPITVTGGHLHFLGEETDGQDEMIRQTRLRQKHGCNAIKLIVTGGQMTPGSLPERVSMTTDEIRSVCEEAKLLQLPTFAHCLTTEGFVRCMDGGVDCIEHIACFVRNKGNGLLERVWEPEIMERYAGQRRFFMMGLSAGYHNLDDYRSGRKPCTAREEFLLKQEERMFEIFGNCIALGLIPVCGTDAGTNGTMFSETALELVLMVERGGMTIQQAIDACVVGSAKCLGIQDNCIRLENSANIIAMKTNPLIDPRAFLRVEEVVLKGKIVK